MNNKKYYINLILCYVVLALSLCGCDKQKSNYVPEATFEYNNSQESIRIVEKPTEETTTEEIEEEQLAHHSLGYTQENHGVVIQDTMMESAVVMPMGGMPTETHQVTPEDAPANDDISVDESEKENTEAPKEEPQEEPNTENIVEDSPVIEPVTTETVIPEQPSTEAPPVETPPLDNPPENSATGTDATENVPTEGGEVPDNTDQSGADSGEGGNTGTGAPTDENGDSSQVTPNPDDSGSADVEQPGDSQQGDGTGGTGEEGSSDAGGEAGGNESGDNNAGNSNEGDGGSGDGGTGTGGDNEQGDGAPTQGGVTGDPSEIKKLRYEGELGEYIWGEPADTSKLTVYATFGDGREEVVTDYAVYMNYPERRSSVFGDMNSWQLVDSYTPGEYNATISYGGTSIYCPYDLNIVYVMVTVGHVAPCRKPDEHQGLIYEPAWGGYLRVEQTYDDFTDCYYCGLSECEVVDGESIVSGSFNMLGIPLYYDYSFTIDGDLKAGSYSASEAVNLGEGKILGAGVDVYKNSVDIKNYMGMVHSDIRIIYDDLQELGIYWK